MPTAILNHLQATDPILKQVIVEIGPYRPENRFAQSDLFSVLTWAIISQQISLKAANTVYQRLLNLYPDSRLSPETLLTTPEDTLRQIGLTRPKVSYLRDLARNAIATLPPLETLNQMDDAAVIATLTQVKGIGPWTAQMLLIFRLNRLDVLPVADLGVRRAIQQLYNLDTLPDRTTIERIAQPWQPYRSVAVWYLWRSLGQKI
ncbi:MAG: DNA-3-methyladenine glycosylase [Jaaginema sp. PMC 1079.18]|nr:DNA-3-methyladenine glycosylase [Jaaginema sp. PMC 1080.18]MEC4849475.1 DNA-3-methyladenine glycosylase [Jaaginema sp. PMC 1079.18]MEC4866021.1 DNA-3-methyladenine glycosylase [Jaaginema sp. PMC 1078.18]